MQQLSLNIFQQIGNLSSDVYFAFDSQEQRFLYVSPAFESVWDLPVSSVLEDPQLIMGTIAAEDREYVMERYQQSRVSGGEVKFTFKIGQEERTHKYISASIYKIADGYTHLLAGIAQDITVIKNNILYAEKINARKNAMLSVLSHDLRGPIGVVRLMASSIQRDPSVQRNQQILEVAQTIQDLCKRNITLIRDLLDQEFLESGSVQLRKERVDLIWTINDMFNQYKRSSDAAAKQFKLTSLSDNLYIQIDNLKLMQVLNNLISNSIKFTKDGGIIEVSVKDEGNDVLISVKDNGIGIPDDLKPYLFDKFTRARRPGLQGEETTGLGMSIIKTIVELHGGSIDFISSEHVGSTFYIRLPKE